MLINMRQIDIEVLRTRQVKISIHLKDKGSFIIRQAETRPRIPEVGRFVVRNIEALRHTLGGDYDELPPGINPVRQFILDRGYTDAEVAREVELTLRQASGTPEAKRILTTHVSELLVPMAA